MKITFKFAVVLFVVTILSVQCLTNKELTECQRQDNIENICIKSGNPDTCFQDLRQQCQDNTEHKQNKACAKFNNPTQHKLDLELFYEDTYADYGKEGRAKDFKSPEQIKKITDETGFVNTDEIKRRYQTQYQDYQTKYATWKASKTSQTRKPLFESAKNFAIDVWLYMASNYVFSAEHHIAGIECTTDCAKRLTQSATQQYISNQLKCFGNRPAGKSIDGTTQSLESGATQEQLQSNIQQQQKQEQEKKKQEKEKQNLNNKTTNSQLQYFSVFIISTLMCMII